MKVYTIVYLDGTKEVQEHPDSINMLYCCLKLNEISVYDGSKLSHRIRKVKRYKVECFEKKGVIGSLEHPATG